MIPEISQDELVDWYWALLEGCLDPEQFTMEEGERLCDEGYADFMGDWATEINHNLTEENRRQTHADYFYANGSLEETVDWYMAVCEHINNYNKCSDEEAAEMRASDEIWFYFRWADSIYATLPRDAQETLMVEVIINKDGSIYLPENPPEKDDYLGPEMN